MPPAPDPVLSVTDIVRQYGPVRALDGVSIGLLPGQVHCLIGENGAGKSTLMKIMSGVERPDSGTVRVGGQIVELRSVVQAQSLGIAMIHQELNLVDQLCVADNIFLGREKHAFGWVDSGSTRSAAAALLAEVGCSASPDARVATLSIAQKQLVEIAKAVSIRARVLIMDEPTAVLGGRETAALFELIGRLKADGVAVVYISHLLPEVLHLADRVTVLRDGRVVETMDAAAARAAGERGLASKMVGRAMADHFPKRDSAGTEIRLDVKNVTVPGVVHDVSFFVRKGEVLGFAGLIGAGRTETAEAICGLRPRSAGSISVDGSPVRITSVRGAIRAGLAYLSEDRKGTGLNLGMSIAANTTLASLKSWRISRRAELATAKGRVSDLKIKVGSVDDPVSSLSGGNQQKVAIAKWLETEPRVLFVDEPTRGVDIGAKEQIYQLLQSLTRAGMACILISSELNEVIGLSHRVAVVRGGRIVAVLDAADATEEKIMHFAAGVAS
jgi:ribose transport system ATP-binding protein